MKPAARHALPLPSGARRRPATAAFSLIELSVALLVISVLATLAVPYWKRAQTNARTAAFVNDLRVFAGAFQNYANERSDWPVATLVPAETPAGMQGYLSTTNWERNTPIGGAYTWARDTVQQGERYRAALLVLSVGENRVTQDRQLLLEIDRKLDDGNLETGNFRLGFRNQPVFVIEQ